MREPIRISSQDQLTWEPYTLGDGTPAGQVGLLRRRDTRNEPMYVGIYHCDHEVVGTETYDRNDSMFVLEGEVWITTSDGVEHHFGVGDLVTVAKGEKATFRQSAGFKKFFVANE